MVSSLPLKCTFKNINDKFDMIPIKLLFRPELSEVLNNFDAVSKIPTGKVLKNRQILQSANNECQLPIAQCIHKVDMGL